MEEAVDLGNTTVRVAVRVRPFSEKEIREGGTECVEINKDATVILHGEGGPPASFAFDHVFGQESTQEEVFENLGVPLLDKSFEGYNATVFAYGQTGSGKTHTMMSDRKTDNRGLIPRISENLFDRIAKLSSDARKFLVCCSFLEIYNEIVYDLLVPRGKNTPKTGLEIREGKGIGVYVKDLQEIVVDSSDKLQRLIDQGFEHRATAATQMNSSSSRSHCLFIIKMHQKDDENSSNNNFCKMNLVDLAGSERASRTGAQGDTLKEGANINKSLSALGNVINALSSMASGSKKVFIPYRNSKLTRVLQESLGGNALTTMMAALSPSKTNWEETLGTLNYAKRAKTIKVCATKNEEAEQIAKLQEEVEALRLKLTEQASGVADTSRYETQIQEMEKFMKQSWEDKERESKKHEEDLKKLEAEARRAAEKIHAERDRRLRLLEEKGDLELSVQELKSLDGPEAWAQTIASWPSQITRLLNLEQRVSTQSRAAALLKNAVEQDVEHWCERQKQVQEAGGNEEDGGAGLRMLLQQAERKVTTMLREFDSLTKQEQELKQEQAFLLPQVKRVVVGIQLTNDEEKDEKKEKDNEEGAKEDTEQVSEEYKAILQLVFRQLDARRARAWGQIAEEHETLGSFVSRLQELLQCCAGLGADIAQLSQETEMELAIGGSSGSKARALPLHGAEAAAAWALPLGLASSEVPDASITASSNGQAVGSVRLLGGVEKMTCAYGGWTPVKDEPSEFVQIDLGKAHSVCGVGLQGRRPCSGSWDLTRPLLAQLLDPTDPLPPNRIFKRPPVRLIHDVFVAVHGRHAALTAGKPDFSAGHLDYKTLQNGDRQAKVDFFELLLAKASHAIKGAGWTDKIKPLKLSSAEILGGKNTSETNRLLQILCYLGLRKKLGEEAAGGLLNIGDQWVTSFTVSWSNDGNAWTPLSSLGADASKPLVFEGSVDAEKMRYQAFGSAQPPGPVRHLRVNPQEWHGHAGMRLEFYGWAEDAPQTKQPSSLTNPACRLDVVYSRGMLLQRCLSLANAAAAERWQERQKAEEAKNEQALQERTQVEQQLQDSKAQLEELKKTFALLQDQAAETEQKLMDAEADSLRLKVDCESYESQVKSIEEKLESASQSTSNERSRVRELESELESQKAAAEDLQQQIGVLTEERDLARSREEELFDTLTSKEEELMNTNDGYVYLTDQLNEVRDDYEDKLDQRDRLIETLNDRNKELLDEGLALRQEIGEAKRKVADAEKAVARAEKGLPVNFKVASATAVDSAPSDGYATEKENNSKKEDGEYEEDFDDE